MKDFKPTLKTECPVDSNHRICYGPVKELAIVRLFEEANPASQTKKNNTSR